MPTRPTCKLRDLLRRAFSFGLTRFVFESHHGIGVADVEIIAPERHAKGPCEPSCEHETLIDAAVAVRVSKYGYPAGLSFSDEDISVWRKRHCSRVLKLAFGIHADLVTRRQRQLGALRSRDDFRIVAWARQHVRRR